MRYLWRTQKLSHLLLTNNRSANTCIHLSEFIQVLLHTTSSSSWHSLSCCKSRLKREDFCNGGGCCGRRIGAGIALLGCCGRATLSEPSTCWTSMKLQKNAGIPSHVLNLCWKSSWGLTLLVSWAFSLASLDPEGWPQNNQLKSASLMSVGDK